MVHYTYWIIDNVNKMYYHGVHTSENPHCIRSYHGSSIDWGYSKVELRT